MGIYPVLHRFRRWNGQYMDVSRQSLQIRRRHLSASLFPLCHYDRPFWRYRGNGIRPRRPLRPYRRLWPGHGQQGKRTASGRSHRIYPGSGLPCPGYRILCHRGLDPLLQRRFPDRHYTGSRQCGRLCPCF